MGVSGNLSATLFPAVPISTTNWSTALVTDRCGECAYYDIGEATPRVLGCVLLCCAVLYTGLPLTAHHHDACTG